MPVLPRWKIKSSVHIALVVKLNRKERQACLSAGYAKYAKKKC